MNEISLSLANLLHHVGANRGRRQLEEGARSHDFDSVDHTLHTSPAMISHHDLHIYESLQFTTQGLEMSLHAADLRRIKLADMENSQLTIRDHLESLLVQGSSP